MGDKYKHHFGDSYIEHTSYCLEIIAKLEEGSVKPRDFKNAKEAEIILSDLIGLGVVRIVGEAKDEYDTKYEFIKKPNLGRKKQ